MKRLVLEHIEGIEIYPILSLIIFVALFIGVIVYAIKIDKRIVDKVSSMPLDSNDNSNDYEHSKNA